jgi:hypothetical protein
MLQIIDVIDISAPALAARATMAEVAYLLSGSIHRVMFFVRYDGAALVRAIRLAPMASIWNVYARRYRASVSMALYRRLIDHRGRRAYYQIGGDHAAALYEGANYL